MKPQIYRSKLAWIFGWAWLVFAAWNTWDLIAHGRMPSALIAGAVLGVITALVFVMALRPAILAEEGGVRVRNVLRNAYIPWNAVDDLSVTSAIVIESGGTAVRCWTPQATARERARAAGQAVKAASSKDRVERATAAVGGRTHADWVAQQLEEMSRSRRQTSTGETRVTWSPSALAVLAAALALVVAAVVLS
ncbi:PH domain-containing protein [Microbispora sp. H10670]|uniref:PH domain-containing protein n=1 Tax=Microbispora sp. H10670 TaxID=2729108 RepID=UPI001602E713|nr:PH domain-containing protein [Microbispora sp. H10670]